MTAATERSEALEHELISLGVDPAQISRPINPDWSGGVVYKDHTLLRLLDGDILVAGYSNDVRYGSLAAAVKDIH